MNIFKTKISKNLKVGKTHLAILEMSMFFLYIDLYIFYYAYKVNGYKIHLIIISSHGHSCKKSFILICFLNIHEWSGFVNSSNPRAITMYEVLLCRYIMVCGFFTLEGNYTSGRLWPRFEQLYDPNQMLENCINFQSGSKR